MQIQVFYKNYPAPQIVDCFDCSVSCEFGRPPSISAKIPRFILDDYKDIVKIACSGFSADFTEKRENVENVELSANYANVLQKTRIDLSSISGNYTALQLIQLICQNLGITLQIPQNQLSRLNYPICYSGFQPDFAINILNLICNYFGYLLQILEPLKITIADFAFFDAITCNFSDLTEENEEQSYNSLCLSRVSPNAEVKTYAYAKKIGKDAGEWQNPNILLLEGEYIQNEGLSVDDYKLYMQEYEIDLTEAEFNLYALSIASPFQDFQNAKTAEWSKVFFYCAPAIDKFCICKEQHIADQYSFGQLLAKYETDFAWWAVFCPSSWVAGRDMYQNGDPAEPFFNITEQFSFFSNEQGTQIPGPRFQYSSLMGGDPKNWPEGWVASTLDPSDPKYNDPTSHYPNVKRYSTNTIDFINLPDRSNWPYWHLTREITNYDVALSEHKTAHYDSGQAQGSYDNYWQYCQKIEFSKALWSSGFGGISGIPASDLADTDFFNPRILAANNKDCFYQGAGTPKGPNPEPGEANMAELPEIKYTVKLDDSYHDIYLAPGRVKMAARLKWGYGEQKSEYATSSAPSFVIQDLAAASMTAQELTAVQAGEGEQASADLSYTIGDNTEESLNIVSFVWFSRQNAENCFAHIFKVLGGSPRKIAYKTPSKNAIIGKTISAFGANWKITRSTMRENGTEGEAVFI